MPSKFLKLLLRPMRACLDVDDESRRTCRTPCACAPQRPCTATQPLEDSSLHASLWAAARNVNDDEFASPLAAGSDIPTHTLFPPNNVLSCFFRLCSAVDLTGNRLRELPDLAPLERIRKFVVRQNLIENAERVGSLTTLTHVRAPSHTSPCPCPSAHLSPSLSISPFLFTPL